MVCQLLTPVLESLLASPLGGVLVHPLIHLYYYFSNDGINYFLSHFTEVLI